MSINQLGKFSNVNCLQNIFIRCVHDILQVTPKIYVSPTTKFLRRGLQLMRRLLDLSGSERCHEPEKNQVQRVSRLHSCVMFVLLDLSLRLKSNCNYTVGQRKNGAFLDAESPLIWLDQFLTETPVKGEPGWFRGNGGLSENFHHQCMPDEVTCLCQKWLVAGQLPGLPGVVLPILRKTLDLKHHEVSFWHRLWYSCWNMSLNKFERLALKSHRFKTASSKRGRIFHFGVEISFVTLQANLGCFLSHHYANKGGVLAETWNLYKRHWTMTPNFGSTKEGSQRRLLWSFQLCHDFEKLYDATAALASLSKE